MGLFKFLKTIFGKQTPFEMAMAAAPKEDGFGAPIEPMTMVPNDGIVNDHFVAHKITFDKELKPNETAVLEWKYLPGMTKEQIEDIIPQCGCTANITWGTVGVRAVFTHTEKNIPEDGGFVTKTLTVYFRDGYGRVSDGRGGMMYDPNKKRRVLSFTGKLLPK